MGSNNIDPARQWATKTFDDAVVAAGVGWMVVQWEIRHEPSVRSNCKVCHDYTLFPNQFNDMPKDMPYEEVRKIFDAHVANRVEHNAKVNKDTDPVRISLFLLKVETVVNITDDQGKLIQPAKDREIPNG